MPRRDTPFVASKLVRCKTPCIAQFGVGFIGLAKISQAVGVASRVGHWAKMWLVVQPLAQSRPSLMTQQPKGGSRMRLYAVTVDVASLGDPHE